MPAPAPLGEAASLTGFRAAESYRGDTARAVGDARRMLGDGWRVVLVTEGHGPAERLVERLREADVAARLDVDLPELPEAGIVHVATGRLEHGFVHDGLRIAVLTESDLVGQRTSTKDMRRMPSRRRQQVDPLQLRAGDLVVHEQHGVGRYVEMVQRTVQGATREYLVIEYAPAKRGQPGDRLYVPSDALDQVTKYVGGEAPALHRLGGADWAKAKGRARKAVKEIAGELIRLYSARMAAPGYAFGPDTPWQRELEDAFPYVETPDQLSTIDEVKADMERPVPMDRVVCGDVGYGKTEIAVRAAFKAVQDGKQVAILVPTTLLVQQHLSTFGERFANFPVNVAGLSRFQTDGEAKLVLEGLTDGTVDLVIGTHRLLTTGVRFKDLGLVVVDEEQRFGVEHKEHLKALRTHVDVLTMSATPIPRTLEMAVTGIREMSTITTPPEERHPVLTFVGAYDERQITAAVRRELLREGQVFYIHNRVESIDRAAERLRRLVPEARIRVAHGQMHEHELEQVIIGFWEKDFDVLVCTTIVESGIDIANANTLIVERADVFGLSQLHQLRGRVGRARERAYAYFLYPPEKPLTELAHDRLATIAQNTDLGSGMAVAMKDLEIRGAGNLLGGEQSGHIADVGFDLYIRLVGEAVAAYRGDAVEEPAEVKVELPLDAHIPHAYVPGERLRLEAYRRIAAITSDADAVEVRAELVDRYGPLPRQVETLLEVARFRSHVRQAGLTDVTLQGTNVRFAPVELPDSGRVRLARLYPGSIVKPAIRTILVPRPRTARVGGTPLGDTDLLAWARDLVDALLLEGQAPTRRVSTEGIRMTRTPRLAVVLAAAAAATVLLTACNPAQAGAAALVGDIRITESRVNEATSDALAAAATLPDGQADSLEPAAVLRQNVNRLIASELLATIAVEEGIVVTQGEIDALLAQASAGTEPDEFAAQIALQAGVPPEDLESFARDFLIQQKLGQKLAPTGDANAQQAASRARLVQEADERGVTVSPRYGAWDPTQAVVSGDLNDLSVTPSPTAAPEE